MDTILNRENYNLQLYFSGMYQPSSTERRTYFLIRAYEFLFSVALVTGRNVSCWKFREALSQRFVPQSDIRT